MTGRATGRTSLGSMTRWLLSLCMLPALVAACPGTETREVPLYDPYVGPEVFPTRRAKLPAVVGDLGLVSNTGSDTITAIDVAQGKVLATVPVGKNPVDIDGTHHVAVDRGRGFAYAAFSYPPSTTATGPHASHGSSTRLGLVQKLRLEDLAVVGEVRVDPNPGDIVLSDDGKRLVVTHFDLARATSADAGTGDRRATIALIDPEKILAVGSPEPVKIAVCPAPHGVALSRPTGDVAYVSCYGADAIAVVDLTKPSATPTLVKLGGAAQAAPLPAIYGPYSAILSPSGAELVVASTESKDVRFLDVATRTFTNRVFDTKGAPFFPAWAPDESVLYVPTQLPDGVRVIDPKTGQSRSERAFTASECQRPHEAVLGTDPSTVWIVCEGDRKAPSVVLGLDRDTLATRVTFPVGVYPDRLILGRPR